MIPITIRLDEIPRRKLKVIAGYEDKSLNSVITNAIDKRIRDWEKTHGEILLPQE